MRIRVSIAATLVALCLRCSPFTAEPASAEDGGVGDAGIDGRVVDAGDGGCTDTVIVGSSAEITQTDMNPKLSSDAYGYFVREETVARCAHVFLDIADGGSPDVLLGIYEDRPNERQPEALLNQARVHNAVSGWNVARLEHEISFPKNTFVWLALMAIGDGIGSRVVTSDDCKTNPGAQHSTNETKPELPNPWGNASIDSRQCNAALFLSP